jgi:hypothetical protein
MLKVFFITALVHTTMTPDTGWLQWTQSYSTKEACHEVIWKDFDKIHEGIKKHTDKILIGIMELRCMTYDEALKLNSELGH